RFVQQGPLPADTNLVGVPLLKLSARGYAQVQLADGPVWIDKMHLQYDREVPQGYCGRLVTSAEGGVVRGVRGRGRGCPWRPAGGAPVGWRRCCRRRPPA